MAIFGTGAVAAMLVCYALESRGRHFVLLFAGACAASSTYAVLIAAWPFRSSGSDLGPGGPPTLAHHRANAPKV